MKKKVVPYLLLAPMILIMGALVFYPVAATFSYSLKKWKLTQPGDIRVIGFKNYVDILTSDSFWYSLQKIPGIFILKYPGAPLRGIAGAGGASVGAAPFC